MNSLQLDRSEADLVSEHSHANYHCQYGALLVANPGLTSTGIASGKEALCILDVSI